MPGGLRSIHVHRGHVHRIHVYRATTSPRPGALRLLDDLELRRLARLRRQDDRDRYVTTHALARLAVADHSGVEPHEVLFTRVCATCGGDHGKPRARFAPGACPQHGALDPTTLPLTTDGRPAPPGEALIAPPWVSLSHSGGVVLVAVSRAGDLGVDVEEVTTAAFEGFADVALSSCEAAQLQAVPPERRPWAQAVWWTRKEAVLKATGHGLATDPRRVVVTPPGAAPAVAAWEGSPAPPGPLVIHDVPVGEHHAAAVAVITTLPTTLAMQDGDALLDRLR